MCQYQPVKKKSFDQREIRTHHEPVIARMRARNYTKDLHMCNIFSTFVPKLGKLHFYDNNRTTKRNSTTRR